MSVFERALKVSKTDAYAIDVCLWLGGDTVTSFSVTDESGGLVNVGATSIDGSCLNVLLTGVSAGTAEIHFTYSTLNRTDCFAAFVEVVEDC